MQNLGWLRSDFLASDPCHPHKKQTKTKQQKTHYVSSRTMRLQARFQQDKCRQQVSNLHQDSNNAERSSSTSIWHEAHKLQTMVNVNQLAKFTCATVPFSNLWEKTSDLIRKWSLRWGGEGAGSHRNMRATISEKVVLTQGGSWFTQEYEGNGFRKSDLNTGR